MNTSLRLLLLAGWEEAEDRESKIQIWAPRSRRVSCEFLCYWQREDEDTCGHSVTLSCQLQTSSPSLWSPFPQIGFLPGKTLTIPYSASNRQQLVLANGPGHCLGYMWFLFKRDKLLLKPDPHAEHLSSPLRYNEVETVSIFHLNKEKKLPSHLKSSWPFPLGLVNHLVRGLLGDSCSGQELGRKVTILCPFEPHSFNVVNLLKHFYSIFSPFVSDNTWWIR